MRNLVEYKGWTIRIPSIYWAEIDPIYTTCTNCEGKGNVSFWGGLDDDYGNKSCYACSGTGKIHHESKTPKPFDGIVPNELIVEIQKVLTQFDEELNSGEFERKRAKEKLENACLSSASL